MKKLISIFLGIVCLSIMSNATADEAGVVGKAIKILTTADDKFGGCMILLDASISNTGLNCPAANWVSFSCSGHFTSKDNAMRMFDVAQMSYALDKKLLVIIKDTMKHNGYCVATRIDAL